MHKTGISSLFVVSSKDTENTVDTSDDDVLRSLKHNAVFVEAEKIDGLIGKVEVHGLAPKLRDVRLKI